MAHKKTSKKTHKAARTGGSALTPQVARAAGIRKDGSKAEKAVAREERKQVQLGAAGCRKGSMSEFICAQLLAGKELEAISTTTQALFKEKAKKVNAAYVSWYRSKLRKQGLLKTPKVEKAAA